VTPDWVPTVSSGAIRQQVAACSIRGSGRSLRHGWLLWKRAAALIGGLHPVGEYAGGWTVLADPPRRRQ
jgi:hypothetical protein